MVRPGSASLQNKIAQGADWASKKLMEASDKMQAKYEPNKEPMQVHAPAISIPHSLNCCCQACVLLSANCSQDHCQRL